MNKRWNWRDDYLLSKGYRAFIAGLEAEVQQFCADLELTPAAEIERLRERFKRETEERG